MAGVGLPVGLALQGRCLLSASRSSAAARRVWGVVWQLEAFGGLFLKVR